MASRNNTLLYRVRNRRSETPQQRKALMKSRLPKEQGWVTKSLRPSVLCKCAALQFLYHKTQLRMTWISTGGSRQELVLQFSRKGMCCQPWYWEFNPWNPHYSRKNRLLQAVLSPLQVCHGTSSTCTCVTHNKSFLITLLFIQVAIYISWIFMCQNIGFFLTSYNLKLETANLNT